MIGVILGYIIVGIVVGALGRLLAPGRNPIGILLTIGLGIVGALIGGVVTRALLGAGHDVITFIVSVVVAALLVALVSGPRGRAVV